MNKTLTLAALCGLFLVPGCMKDSGRNALKEPVSPRIGAEGRREADPDAASGQDLSAPVTPPPNYQEPDVTVTVPPFEEQDPVERDSDGRYLTPLDQANAEADADIASSIRRGVADKTDLSTRAYQVDIFVKDGHVVLRGPVDTDEERSYIDAVARSTEGVRNVDDQLEVVAH